MLDGLRNWWAAEPWRVGDDGWHYLTLYRVLRRGSPHPMDPFGHTYLSGGEPKGRLAALWGAISFPHVHGDEFEPDWTVPPGDTLLELMAERDMTPRDLTRKMLVDEPYVHGLIQGTEPVTESVALEFEEIFGVSFDFWMNMERRYREDLERLCGPGCIADFATNPEIRTLAAENGIDVTRCEFCGGPLDAEHPWRRGADGACAHEACLASGGVSAA